VWWFSCFLLLTIRVVPYFALTCWCLSMFASRPSAHKLYPVRVRVFNVIGQAQWVTVAYVPIVRRLKERSADARAWHRRSGVLQRTLYAAFRQYIAYSHLGFAFKLGNRKLKFFPRTLLYFCDRPEERAVFC